MCVAVVLQVENFNACQAARNSVEVDDGAAHADGVYACARINAGVGVVGDDVGTSTGADGVSTCTAVDGIGTTHRVVGQVGDDQVRGVAANH